MRSLHARPGVSLRALASVVALAAIPASSALAATIFVDDNNCPGPGTGTFVDPYCKVSDALAAAAPGDDIHVASGTYVQASTLVVNKSVTIQGDGENPLPLLSGGGTLVNVIQIAANNVTLRNLEVAYATGRIIFQPAAQTGTIIEQNDVHGSYKTFNPDVCGPVPQPSHPDLPNDGNGDDAIGLMSCTNCIVRNNFVHDACGDGIFLGAPPNTIAGPFDALIECNEVVHVCGLGGGIWVNKGTRTTIVNNLVRDICGAAGIRLGDSRDGLHKIYNNFVVDSDFSQGFSPIPESDGNAIAIVEGEVANANVDVAHNTVDNNLAGADYTGKKTGHGIYVADPLNKCWVTTIHNNIISNQEGYGLMEVVQPNPPCAGGDSIDYYCNDFWQNGLGQTNGAANLDNQGQNTNLDPMYDGDRISPLINANCGDAHLGVVPDENCDLRPPPPPPNPPGSMTFTKTASPLNVQNGQKVTYTYTIKNTGPDPITGITITDDNGTPGFPADDFIVNNPNPLTLQPGEMQQFQLMIVPKVDMCHPINGNPNPVGQLVVQQVPGVGCGGKNNNMDVQAWYIQNLGINDNTYGKGCAPDWCNPPSANCTKHTFGNLTGSDKAEFRFYNNANPPVITFDFYLDYVTKANPAPGFPCGYRSLGVSGGEGKVNKGSAAWLLAYDTSITPDLNQCKCALVDSPTFNSLPNSPCWNQVNSYYAKISCQAFPTGAFGKLTIPIVHNSPAKKSPNAVVPTPCPNTKVTNTATAKVNGTPQKTATAEVNVTP